MALKALGQLVWRTSAVMLRLPKKLLFAIEAVLDIAYHSSSSPTQSRDITRRQGIPRRYLEQALQQLVREGILIGVRGPKGGYQLSRERRRVMIGEIVRCVNKMEFANSSKDVGKGSELSHKVVVPLWGSVQESAQKILDTTSIEDLCVKAKKEGINSEGQEKLDFII